MKNPKEAIPWGFSFGQGRAGRRGAIATFGAFFDRMASDVPKYSPRPMRLRLHPNLTITPLRPSGVSVAVSLTRPTVVGRVPAAPAFIGCTHRHRLNEVPRPFEAA